MLRFRFQLRPLSDVGGWGTDGRGPHWFGLTDGWYWIEIDGVELLRYDEATLARFGDVQLPYADYYVVRLWEDRIFQSPEMLEPVPPDLRGFIASDRGTWAERDEDNDDLAAEIWYDDHVLYMGPLLHAPHLRWWRMVDVDWDVLTFAWRNPQREDIGFAAPAEGLATMPTSAFVAAIAELDRELLAAMESRVGECERLDAPADRDLNVEWLRREHEDRRTWLATKGARAVITDWEAVRAGAQILQSRGNEPT